MGTLQSGNSAGQRIKAGNTIIDRASSVDTRAVKKRLDAFRASHRAYVAAHAVTGKASAALITQQRKVGELDDAQDESVEAWAVARIAAGAKRLSAFAEIGGASPSEIKSMGHIAQAKEIIKLAGKDKKHSEPKVKKAAASAEAAARAVIAANEPIKSLTRDRDAAVSGRDAIGPGWEKAFASLKRGVRSAQDDGASGLFAALFDAPARPAKKPKAAPATTA